MRVRTYSELMWLLLGAGVNWCEADSMAREMSQPESSHA